MSSGYYYDHGHHWGYDDVLWYLDGAVGSFILVLSLVIGILTIAATWLVYRKAGERGWASIVPFYAQYVLYKITWGNGWLFLLLFVPFVNFVVGIITLVKLSKSFGHGGGFACGLIFLNTIFMLILGFGSSRYVGPGGSSGAGWDVGAGGSRYDDERGGARYDGYGGSRRDGGADYTDYKRADTVYCPECGSAVSASSKFCPYCGAKLR